MNGRFFWRRILAVFLAAFAVRAVFLAQWAQLPYSHSFCADAWAYNRWALDILRGQLIRHTAFYQSPFYPYFLAGFYKLFGYHPYAVFWVQALVDSCSCVIIMRIAQRCFGARAGLLAGLLSALYRPFIFSTGLLTKETFVIFGMALFALMLLRAGSRGLFRDYLLCGALAGWCVLSRANVLLLVPAALLWLWLRGRQELRTRGARGFLTGVAFPMLSGMMLLIGPATVHNFAASRDLVPVNYTGGFTFFIGNNPEATGMNTYPLGISSDPLLEETQSTRIAEKTAGRVLKPSEVSSFWFRKGLGFIAEHPVSWLGLTCVKFWLFWNWYEIPDNYDIQFIGKQFNTLLKWPLASFALIGSFGAAGLFLCRIKESSGSLLLLFTAYLASLLPFWISDRYRLPELVFLLPLAAAAIERLTVAALRLEWETVWRPCLAASPFILFCLLFMRVPVTSGRFSAAAGWGQLTSIYSDLGEHRRAIDAFRRAAELEPEGLNESAIAKAAFSFANLGQADEALELYKIGSEIYPGSAMLYNSRGILLSRLGRTGEGIELYKKAVEVNPDPGLEYRNLFHCYSKLGKKVQAIKYGELAVARFPRDMELRSSLQALKGRK